MPLPDEVINTLPEEIRQDKSWEKFDDLGGVAKGYVELQKYRGSSIAMPGENSKPEEVQAWKAEHLPKLAARGMIELPPSKVEDYKVPTIEGFNPDPELTASYIKDVAHATGMTPKQLEANIKFHHKMNSEIAAKLMVTPDAAEEQFKQAMGSDYPAIMETVKAAEVAISEDFPQFAEWSKGAYVFVPGKDGKPPQAYPFHSHPMVRGLLEAFGQMIKEDSSDGTRASVGGDSLDAIDTQIADLRVNKELSNDEKGRRLEVLYQKKQAALDKARERAA